jgi:hypothetical protein
MKHQRLLLGIFMVLPLLLGASQVVAQDTWPLDAQASPGTAFTYQGQLKSAGATVNGTCDFQLSLWSAETGGTQSGATLTKTSVVVSDGLFAVSLDFGSAAFDGNPRWLEIAVRCPAGSGNFTSLAPRQPLAPAPYAIYASQAGSVPWSGVSGAPPQLPGGCGNNQVAKWNGSAWICANDATGGGEGWSLTGNAGTNPNTNFIGTTDNVGLKLIVNGAAALRLLPNAISPNVIGGYSGNILAPGMAGAVIAGGGQNGEVNTVSNNFATVGGGQGNTASHANTTVGGGYDNLASGDTSWVGGGHANQSTSWFAAVGGGEYNTATGSYTTISGGDHNTASGNFAAVPGGSYNTAQGTYSFAAGQQAQANHSGTFVWADATYSPFASTGANQFDVRATGGVNLEVGSANAWVNTVPLLPRALPPTANMITTTDNAGDVGRYTSVTIGADGMPVVSYYDNTNHDLKVLHCGNSLCTNGNSIITVDSAGDVGEFTAIIIGADGLPVVSYADRTNGDLKVLHCGDTTCASGNTITSVDTREDEGYYTSISIGADGLPVMSYYDNTYGDLKVLHCGNALCTSGNIATTVDSAGDIGGYSSLSIGADGLPLVSYLNITNGDLGDLKVLHCGNAACTNGNVAITVDSAGDVGYDTSIAIGADGLPVVSYPDLTNGDLKVLHCGNAACTSGNIVTTVDSASNVGYFTSITIGADRLPVVSYYDDTNSGLKVLHCGNVLCNSGNTAITLDSAGSVGFYTSLSIGADGLPVVSYYDNTNSDLKVVHCTNPFCVPYFRRR